MGGRKRVKPRKSWLSNIKEWTQMDVQSLLSSAQDRQLWRSQLVPLRHKPQEDDDDDCREKKKSYGKKKNQKL